MASVAQDQVRLVDDVVSGRYACRAFLDTPVPQAVLHDILDVARFAPSGANIQPWRVYVLAGEPRDRVSAAMMRAFEQAPGRHSAEYEYYPADLPEPFRARREAFGATYYGSLGIDRCDTAARDRQTARNFAFFGAPVGLVFTVDRRLAAGSRIELGAFLQNVMIAARARGLETCPQETLARFHRILRRHLPIAAEEMVICGMSLGYADPEAERRRGVQQKLAVEAFVRFFGFDT